MNIKTATTEKLEKRLKYLKATKRGNGFQASHIKCQLNRRLNN